MECNCTELSTKLDEILELLRTINVSGGKTRKKRAPSTYNIFIGNCMRSGKDMKSCAAEYKSNKPSGL